MKKTLLACILIVCLLCTFTVTALAAPADGGKIIYVTPGGTGDGTAWDNALPTIAGAMTAAVAGDKIYVKAGTYNITAVITLKSGVKVFGGFAGTEADESERDRTDKDANGIVEAWEFANETVIQSNGTARIFHGPVSAALTVVDGFTLTGAGNTSGGSVATLNTNVQMFNCTVKDNPNGGRGLIYVDGGGLFHSYIYNNKGAATPSDRGTVYVYYNTGQPSTIAYCKIEGNKAQYGGGIYSRANAQVSIINNLIIDNEATTRGGGVYIGSGSSAPANGHLYNNTIMGNIVSSSTFAQGGDGDGSGLFAEGGTYAYNNVIASNEGPAGCQQVACSQKAGAFVFKNNALGDLDDIAWITGAPANPTTLENNIDVEAADVLFDTGSYLPTASSKLFNAGDKTLFPDSTTLFDLAGNPRVQNDQIDIGAYESAVNEYTITITTGEGGSASPSGPVSVFEGASLEITFTPDSNYTLSSVTVDDVTQAAISPYTFTNVTADHNIHATFSYTGGGGTTGPTYRNRTLTDSGSGVRVSGNIRSDAQLRVTPLTLHADDAACNAIQEAQARGDLILGLNIELTRGFVAPLTISIPVGSQYNGQTVTILHCINGRLETIMVTVVNGMATFEVWELSPFGVVRSMYVPGQQVTSPPKTGDAAMPVGFALIGLAIVCAAGLAVRRRRA